MKALKEYWRLHIVLSKLKQQANWGVAAFIIVATFLSNQPPRNEDVGWSVVIVCLCQHSWNVEF